MDQHYQDHEDTFLGLSHSITARLHYGCETSTRTKKIISEIKKCKECNYPKDLSYWPWPTPICVICHLLTEEEGYHSHSTFIKEHECKCTQRYPHFCSYVGVTVQVHGRPIKYKPQDSTYRIRIWKCAEMDHFQIPRF